MKTAETEPRSIFLWPVAVLVLVIVVLVAWTHAPALTARAIYFDDPEYVLENHLVLNPGWHSAATFLKEVLEPSTVHGYYQPLAMISLMFDVAMGATPDDIRIVHRTSLILHVINSVLICLLIYQLFRTTLPVSVRESQADRVHRDHSALSAAGICGLIFGLHPLTVECTAWMAERKTLLATAFALLSLLAYVRYTRTCRRSALVASGFSFLLALMSKPTVTFLPVVMLIMDVWPLGRIESVPSAIGKSSRLGWWRSFAARALEKLPLLALSATSALITIISQGRTSQISFPRSTSVLSIPVMLSHNIAFYAKKFVWPTHLVPWYVGPESLAIKDPALLGGIIGTLLILLLLAISLRWTRALAFSWLIWFVAIFPSMGIIGFTGVVASDKYMYFPMIGFLMAIGWALTAGMVRRPERGMARFLIALPIGAALCAEAYQTQRTFEKWQSTEQIYAATLTEQPHAGIVHNNYANLLVKQGKVGEAARHYLATIEYNPEFEKGYLNLGSLLATQDHPQEAIKLYERALALKPDYLEALANLTNAYVQLKDYDRALEAGQRLVKYHPNYAPGYHAIAGVYSLQKDWPRVIEFEQKALALSPDDLEAQLGLAAAEAVTEPTRAIETLQQAVQKHPAAYAPRLQLADLTLQQGNAAEAERQYRELIGIAADSAVVHNNLANALVVQRRFDDALREAREAIRLDTGYANAHFNAGTILLQMNRPTEAIPDFEVAVKLRPDFAKGHHYLGIALSGAGRGEEGIAHYREAAKLDPENQQIRGSLDEALSARHNAVTRPETKPWTQPGK